MRFWNNQGRKMDILGDKEPTGAHSKDIKCHRNKNIIRKHIEK
jgi:hypothetical protein